MATESTLESTTFLQPSGFKLVVLRKRFRNLEFFAQSVTHPDVTASGTQSPFRLTDAYIPGDKLEYGTLTVDAILDENMNVYKEMHRWLERTVTEVYKTPSLVRVEEDDVTEYDISLQILSSHNNVIDTIRYKNAFPINIGSINFRSTVDSVEFITVPITFAYTTFTITE